jgi:Family of unknown function (DUF6335)
MAKKKSRGGRTRPRSAKKTAGRGRVRKVKKTAKRGRKVARVVRRSSARKTARKVAVPRRAAKAPAKKAAGRTSAAAAPKRSRAPVRRAPTLDRARRTVAETEGVPTPPSSLNMDRSASAVKSGRAEMVEKAREHTSSSPALTAGDVDADWEAAEAVGDEAPGGDNPTPDQDVVDDIGRALGVEYDDDEELQGGDEITARDKKRWELDPASSDDFDDRE